MCGLRGVFLSFMMAGRNWPFVFQPDFYNSRIQKYNSAGIVTTVINSNSTGYVSILYIF
jgi:hypothetical protein